MTAPPSPRSRGRTRGLVAVATSALLTVGLTALPQGASAAVGVPTTYKGAVYTSAATGSPTADKPQSKLWYADGAWWGLLLDSSGVVRPHELRDHAWVPAGDVVDTRATSTGDALLSQGRLYVGSRASSGGLQLVRMTYDGTRRSWARDAGFPVQVAAGGAESMTIDRDTAGRVWATWTSSSTVWVAHSNPDGSFTDPFRIPGADTAVAADDISSVVSFAGRIGVMWSDQVSDRFGFAVHDDTAAGSTGWTHETPLAGSNMSDDHINLKTLVADSSGRLHAAVKTSQGDGGEPVGSPSIAVLTRDGGTWTSAVAGVTGQSLTRPMLLLDESAGELYLMATSPESGGTVYYKKTPLSDIRFGTGKGDPFLTWSGAKINNVTGTKQPVNARTGIVVLGADDDTRTYFHAEMALSGTPAPESRTTSVTFRGASATGGTGGTTLSVAKPAGTVEGDVLVASIDARGKPGLSAPAGWGLVRYDEAGTTIRKATWVKVAGSAEPSSYTFALSTASGASAVVSAYSGVATTGSVLAAAGQVGDGSTTLVAPSVTTSEVPHLVVSNGIARATDISPGVDLTERGQATAVAKYVTTTSLSDGPAAAGASGTRTSVADAAAASISHTVALKPLAVSSASPSASTDSSPSPSPSPSPSETVLTSTSPSPTTDPSPTSSSSSTGGAVVLRAATTAANAATAGITVSTPAGTAAGDVLLASVDARGAPTVTAPAGWTLVRHDAASTTMGKTTFVRVAAAGEPASWSFTFSKAQSASAVLSAWSGASVTAPVETSSGSVNASSTSLRAASVPASTGAQVVALYGVTRLATVTPPAGLTELGEVSAANSYAVSSEAAHVGWTATGDTGDLTATASGAAVSIGQLVVLRPMS